MKKTAKKTTNTTSSDQDIVPLILGHPHARTSLLVEQRMRAVTTLEHCTVLRQVPYNTSLQHFATPIATRCPEQHYKAKTQENENHLDWVVGLLTGAVLIETVVSYKLLVPFAALGSHTAVKDKYLILLRLRQRLLKKQMKREECEYVDLAVECQSGVVYTNYVANINCSTTPTSLEGHAIAALKYCSLVPMTYGISR